MTYGLSRLLSLTAGAALGVLLGSASPAEAATNYSVQSGPWETAATWSSGVPGNTDDIIIMASHVVEMGNTTAIQTYTIRSLEVRPGGRLQRWNPGTTGTFQCGVRCTNIGPTGYSILNRGQIHNQLNSTTFIQANGPVRTDGSAITSRTSQPMGGFSWGWNNLGHGGGMAWAHGHTAPDGNSTSGICLILNGGTVSSPYALSQAGAINIDGPSFAPSLDALPRVYVNGSYTLGSNLEIFSFESRIEIGGRLTLNGYRLLMQGPLHVGSGGAAATFLINDGVSTNNIGTWPQFRITSGPACTWAGGALVEIPTGSHGSASLGTAVQMTGNARLNLYGQPTIPAALQNGGAPTFWIIGNLMVGGTARVDIVVPGSPNNPTNAFLQVGQDLSFENTTAIPQSGSAGWITQTGNHGATGFPVVLVQSAAGGGNAFLPASDWRGLVGGTTPGSTTAGWTSTNSTVIHQGGVNVFDDFRFLASGGNPGSVWGLHSIQIGLASYQWGASTVNITSQTNLAMGGLGTLFTIDNSALSVMGNRSAVNGGGGNVFVSGGGTFTQTKIPTNLPADGSLGVVDVNGNLQVTGAGVYNLGLASASDQSTLRVLGQGTIPPSNITGVPQLTRQAPLGNVSIDDGGSLLSPNASNVLVFIGEKWHSASVTIKIHPSKVTDLYNGRQVTFQATGGTSPYTFSIVTGSGTLAAATYTAPATGSGQAIVRVTDSANPQQFVDAVVSYRGLSLGTLSMSPGFAGISPPGYCYYLRGDLGTTVNLRAFGGSGTYSWTRTGVGSISATSGQTVVYTASGGSATTTAAATITLSDGTGTTRTAYLWSYGNTFYGYTYPTPYYMYHLRVGDTQTYTRPSNSGTWSFTTNPSGATLNGGTSATGTSVTVNAGVTGGVTSYSLWNYGTVTSLTATGYFYFYTTALPSNLTISPTQFEGWLPGASYTFTAAGGNSPYVYSLLVNGGGSTCSNGGNYSAGATSSLPDTVRVQDQPGVTVQAIINKAIGTPPTGNSYIAAPGAKTIFTNSTAGSVDTILFADANDDFGTFQVLKTLASGNRVLAASIEISPILLTMTSGTSQTFTAVGGTTPYTYSITVNNSGGSINAGSGVYTSGNTSNRVDTVQVRDANGKIARATVNVVSSSGATALEIRPRYIYYIYPGQQMQFRATGGVGGVSWTMLQNGSGGSVSGTGLYTAGPTGAFVQDRIRVADSAGNVDIAWVYVWTTTTYVYPLWAYWDINTGAGKSRNGFDPGQTLFITTTGLGSSPNWQYSGNASKGGLTGSGPTAIWTAGNTGNVTDNVQCSQGPTTYTGYYKVLPPPIAISPSQASVFGGTVLRFTATGGTGSYIYSILNNASGATLTQSGTPAVGMYTAGLTGGTDTVRISDGNSWADIWVSVLSQANPTSIFCSHADLWHGELDLNGRTMRVRRQGATPAGQGDLISTNGGIAGATNPTLRMGTGSQLTVDRTFVWNRFSNEFISGGTLTIGGSVKITDDAGGTSP
ncbi:MAG: hypothetical protein L0216_10500, partial [Planctomycetales bacterium]|nr:hypothetical protein [Planctomycetales bacterium]